MAYGYTIKCPKGFPIMEVGTMAGAKNMVEYLHSLNDRESGYYRICKNR